MKSRIEINIAILVAVIVMGMPLNAQVSQSNPGQYAIIGTGTAMINKSVSTQIGYMGETSALITAMGAETTQMKNWERKYNSYLKDARGYAESLKAGSTLVADGISLFQSLMEIKRAVKANPEGIAATISMNDLYLETVAEMIKTYSVFKNSIAMGGTKNMLNGAERNQLMWTLSDQLADLNAKLHSLAISIAYYNMMDVWNKATAGMVDKSHEQIADEALDRWKRARKVGMILNPK